MKVTKKEDVLVCNKCGKELDGWEDTISSGEISLTHSSVVGDIFSEGAGKVGVDEQRDYFEKQKFVSFGKNPHQALFLKYGGDSNYHLCWRCSREFVKLLGKFFVTKSGI